MKEYIPNLTEKEIKENHRHFVERVKFYRQRGMDHFEDRRLILEKAGRLKGKILELGAGSGYTTLTLARAGYEVVGIDNDEEMLKITALNLAYYGVLDRVGLYAMDADLLLFGNAGFDNVVAVALFHHLASPDKVLSEMDRVLKEDGKMVIADFNKKGLAIIRSVHHTEGRDHEDLGVGQEYISSYLSGLEYDVRHYEDEFQWVLMGLKNKSERG